MKRFLVGLLVVGAGLALAEAPRIKRAAMQSLEQGFDAMLSSAPEPCELLGNTRGIYLENYGAVFTALVNLVYTPTPNPFRPALSATELRTLHDRKVKKIAMLKGQMQEMLLTMAASPGLDSVRPNEQVVCGVTLFYYSWESVDGLPRQIVVQGEKQQLLQVQNGKLPKSQLESIVKVQEL